MQNDFCKESKPSSFRFATDFIYARTHAPNPKERTTIMLIELFTVFSIVAVIVILLIECWKVYLNHTKLSAFHHVKALPVFGKAIDLIGKNNEEILREFPSVDNLTYAWVGPVLIFHISRPQDVQTIFTSDKCLKKAFPYRFLNNRMGILTAEPNIWKHHRRILNPTLGIKMVNSFMPIFNEKSRKMVDLMERRIDKNVDMQRIMFKQAADTIMSASFGLNWSLQNKRGDYIHDLILSIMQGCQLRIQRVWLWNPIYEMTSEHKTNFANFLAFYRFNRSALEQKRMELAEKMEHGHDELATVKENNNQNYLQKCLQMELEERFTDEMVCDEMDTIFVGSVDTSATTINGLTIMLAIHQDYQERVVDELREIFEDVDEPVTSEHLSRMTFLELCLKESIRHFPIAPIIGRECTEDVPINGGIIPKGSQIFLNVIRMNKEPQYYGDNAHEFYPERFLPDNCADWHPYLSIPFSAGQRNCIGARYAWASLKIAMSYILRRFKLTTHLQMKDVIIKPELLLKIGNEHAIRIERRQWHRN